MSLSTSNPLEEQKKIHDDRIAIAYFMIHNTELFKRMEILKISTFFYEREEIAFPVKLQKKNEPEILEY